MNMDVSSLCLLFKLLLASPNVKRSHTLFGFKRGQNKYDSFLATYLPVLRVSYILGGTLLYGVISSSSNCNRSHCRNGRTLRKDKALSRKPTLRIPTSVCLLG